MPGSGNGVAAGDAVELPDGATGVDVIVADVTGAVPAVRFGAAQLAEVDAAATKIATAGPAHHRDLGWYRPLSTQRLLI